MRLKGNFISQMSKHFPSWHIFHKEIKVFAILTNSFKIYDKRMRYLVHDLVLIDDVVDLSGFNDLCLFHDLYSNDFFCFLVFSQSHLAKGT